MLHLWRFGLVMPGVGRLALATQPGPLLSTLVSGRSFLWHSIVEILCSPGMPVHDNGCVMVDLSLWSWAELVTASEFWTVVYVFSSFFCIIKMFLCEPVTDCERICRPCWTHSRRFSTASCTEELDCATSAWFCGKPTTVLRTILRGLWRAVHHSQEWTQMSHHHSFVRLTNRYPSRDWMLSLSFHCFTACV